MYAYVRGPSSQRDIRATLKPSDELRVAIPFHAPDGGPGLTKFDAPLSPNSVQHFVPNAVDMDRAIFGLTKMGFVLSRRGRMTASLRTSRAEYEKVCGTQLGVHQTHPTRGYGTGRFYFPAQPSPPTPAPPLPPPT